MSKSKAIERAVIRHLLSTGYYNALPEVSWGPFRADFIAWGSGADIIEVEVKRTFEDYLADFSKESVTRLEHAEELKEKKTGRRPLIVWQYKRKGKTPPVVPETKYLALWSQSQEWSPTHFVYAAPEEVALKIALDKNRPQFFGVWAFRQFRDGRNSFYHYKTICQVRRIKRISPEEMTRFERTAGKRALAILMKKLKEEGLG
jgi:hypothetical protein